MRRYLAQDNIVAPLFSPSLFVVAPTVCIAGEISFPGEVRIEGKVQGEVRCQRVIVCHDGTVEGLIVADEVIVEGFVTGSIYATQLALKAECDVEGEIYHAELTLEQGCYFEGKSRRHPHAVLMAPADATSA